MPETFAATVTVTGEANLASAESVAVAELRKRRRRGGVTSSGAEVAEGFGVKGRRSAFRHADAGRVVPGLRVPSRGERLLRRRV
ncbi:hypothetical protein FND50_18785 [Rhodococcus sp. WB9]|nr:hypothetical protein FND50_18785 [Rhodococcus sp. WB9]